MWGSQSRILKNSSKSIFFRSWKQKGSKRDGELSHSEKIQLSTTKVVVNDGMLVPELVGDYLFILSEDSNKNKYLVKIDTTITKNATKEADKFALEEK